MESDQKYPRAYQLHKKCIYHYMFDKRLMDPMKQGLRRQLQMRRIQYLTKYNQMGSFSRIHSNKGDLTRDRIHQTRPQTTAEKKSIQQGHVMSDSLPEEGTALCNRHLDTGTNRYRHRILNNKRKHCQLAVNEEKSYVSYVSLLRHALTHSCDSQVGRRSLPMYT